MAPGLCNKRRLKSKFAIHQSDGRSYFLRSPKARPMQVSQVPSGLCSGSLKSVMSLDQASVCQSESWYTHLDFSRPMLVTASSAGELK